MIDAKALRDRLASSFLADAAYSRLVAAIVGILLLVCGLVASFGKVMLYGDGAYFVFSIAAGNPWELKWKEIAARSTVYALTVVPTSWLQGIFHFEPGDLAIVNGVFYFLLPALQYAVACALVWRIRPELLSFLALQFALVLCLSFGFPTEIYLAPGFLWICLFLIATGRSGGLPFYCSYVALIFCHELTVFSAMLVAWLSFRSAGGTSRYVRAAHVALLAAPIMVLMIVIALGGSEGSQGNLIYTIDPRLLFDNVMLWTLVAASLVLIWAPGRFAQRSRPFTVFAVAALVPALLWLLFDVNFGDGRYAARSWVAGSMVLLAAIFVLAFREGNASRLAGRSSFVLDLALIAAAIGVSSFMLFAFDFWKAERELMAIVSPVEQPVSPRYVPYASLRDELAAGSFRANDKIEFKWPLPYHVLLLSGRLFPKVLPYDRFTDYGQLCLKLGTASDTIPRHSLDSLRSFACNRVPARRPPTLSRRLLDSLKNLF
jgi:uncharacterized membrane protein